MIHTSLIKLDKAVTCLDCEEEIEAETLAFHSWADFKALPGYQTSLQILHQKCARGLGGDMAGEITRA